MNENGISMGRIQVEYFLFYSLDIKLICLFNLRCKLYHFLRWLRQHQFFKNWMQFLVIICEHYVVIVNTLQLVVEVVELLPAVGCRENILNIFCHSSSIWKREAYCNFSETWRSHQEPYSHKLICRLKLSRWQALILMGFMCMALLW